MVTREMIQEAMEECERIALPYQEAGDENFDKEAFESLCLDLNLDPIAMKELFDKSAEWIGVANVSPAHAVSNFIYLGITIGRLDAYKSLELQGVRSP